MESKQFSVRRLINLRLCVFLMLLVPPALARRHKEPPVVWECGSKINIPDPEEGGWRSSFCGRIISVGPIWGYKTCAEIRYLEVE